MKATPTLFVLALAAGLTAVAQTAGSQAAPAGTTPAAPDTSRLTAQQLGISVFPAADQQPAQQRADEAYCYDWAAQNVGYRINASTGAAINEAAQQAGQQAAQNTAQATQGAAVAGAARGAAAGAIVSGITGNDAGEGAAIGALAGAAGGRRARRAASQQQGQAAANQVAQEGQQAIANFKKAMSACLEGKNYTVR